MPCKHRGFSGTSKPSSNYGLTIARYLSRSLIKVGYKGSLKSVAFNGPFFSIRIYCV